MRLFAFKLALALGKHNVDQMLEEIPSSMFTEWMAYYQIEPFGWKNEEYRTGLLAATVANTARNPKKRRKPYKPSEFMRKQKKARAKVRSPQQLAEKIKTAFKMLAG